MFDKQAYLERVDFYKDGKIKYRKVPIKQMWTDNNNEHVSNLKICPFEHQSWQEIKKQEKVMLPRKGFQSYIQK